MTATQRDEIARLTLIIRAEKEGVISKVLYEAQADMPEGSNWNLTSKAACDMLATKVLEALDGSLYE
jgi:hypothetical protein